MCAYLVGLEQINYLCFFGDLKIPDSEDLLSEAVHWLVSGHWRQQKSDREGVGVVELHFILVNRKYNFWINIILLSGVDYNNIII